MSTVYQCGNIKDGYRSSEYHQAVADRKERQASAKAASKQAVMINYTQEGDFTHLAPVGNCCSVIRGN